MQRMAEISTSTAATVTGETSRDRVNCPRGCIDPDGDPPGRGSSAQGGDRRAPRHLAPRGAILKHAAATPAVEKTGRAVVFTSLEDIPARIDDPDLDVEAGRRARAAERRPEGRARHAGGRLPADPEEARGGGREGHGAPVRRAHERHRVRHHRAAHRAGGGAAARSRSCRTATASGSTCRSVRSTSWWTMRNCSAAPPCLRRRPRMRPERGYSWLFQQESPRPTKAATSISCVPSRTSRQFPESRPIFGLMQPPAWEDSHVRRRIRAATRARRRSRAVRIVRLSLYVSLSAVAAGRAGRHAVRRLIALTRFPAAASSSCSTP